MKTMNDHTKTIQRIILQIQKAEHEYEFGIINWFWRVADDDSCVEFSNICVELLTHTLIFCVSHFNKMYKRFWFLLQTICTFC